MSQGGSMQTVKYKILIYFGKCSITSCIWWDWENHFQDRTRILHLQTVSLLLTNLRKLRVKVKAQMLLYLLANLIYWMLKRPPLCLKRGSYMCHLYRLTRTWNFLTLEEWKKNGGFMPPFSGCFCSPCLCDPQADLTGCWKPHPQRHGGARRCGGMGDPNAPVRDRRPHSSPRAVPGLLPVWLISDLHILGFTKISFNQWWKLGVSFKGYILR